MYALHDDQNYNYRLESHHYFDKIPDEGLIDDPLLPCYFISNGCFYCDPYVTNYEWLALSKVSALHVYI